MSENPGMFNHYDYAEEMTMTPQVPSREERIARVLDPFAWRDEWAPPIVGETRRRRERSLEQAREVLAAWSPPVPLTDDEWHAITTDEFLDAHDEVAPRDWRQFYEERGIVLCKIPGSDTPT